MGVFTRGSDRARSIKVLRTRSECPPYAVPTQDGISTPASAPMPQDFLVRKEARLGLVAAVSDVEAPRLRQVPARLY